MALSAVFGRERKLCMAFSLLLFPSKVLDPLFSKNGQEMQRLLFSFDDALLTGIVLVFFGHWVLVQDHMEHEWKKDVIKKSFSILLHPHFNPSSSLNCKGLILYGAFPMLIISRACFCWIRIWLCSSYKILKNLSSPLNLIEFDPTILGIDLSSLTMLTAS